jgi:hypothetical protein
MRINGSCSHFSHFMTLLCHGIEFLVGALFKVGYNAMEPRAIVIHDFIEINLRRSSDEATVFSEAHEEDPFMRVDRRWDLLRFPHRHHIGGGLASFPSGYVGVQSDVGRDGRSQPRKASADEEKSMHESH